MTKQEGKNMSEKMEILVLNNEINIFLTVKILFLIKIKGINSS